MAKQMALTERQPKATEAEILEPAPSATETVPAVASVPTALAPVSDVGGLLTLAINKGINPDGLAKLLDLQERVLQRHAEAAFNEAMQAFQSACPPIVHDRTADAGKYKYTYATLSHIAATIAPLLRELGLSYSFDADFVSETIDMGNGKFVERTSIRATCTVHHVAGHSRKATFQAPIDKGASMNVMQQSASALSYARRYALQLALGITTADTDDDGGGAGRQRNPGPDPADGAPRAQPRSGRVQQADVNSLKKKWCETYGEGMYQDEMRAAFCRWAYETAAVPQGRADQLSAWSRDAIRTCEMALEHPFG